MGTTCWATWSRPNRDTDRKAETWRALVPMRLAPVRPPRPGAAPGPGAAAFAPARPLSPPPALRLPRAALLQEAPLHEAHDQLELPVRDVELRPDDLPVGVEGDLIHHIDPRDPQVDGPDRVKVFVSPCA